MVPRSALAQNWPGRGLPASTIVEIPVAGAGAAWTVGAMPPVSARAMMTAAMVRYAARSEWAVTVEDMLARRWRVLFLDARLAAQMAPRVAELLEQETGIDPALPAFLALCQQYQLSPSDLAGT